MPPKPKVPCSETGCQTLTDGGPCRRHAAEGQRIQRRDHPHLRFYETAAWARMRRRVLLEEPTCRGWPPGTRCGKPSEHVDHIVPIRPDAGGARLERANLQALCSSCHGVKTAGERVERSKLAARSGRDP